MPDVKTKVTELEKIKARATIIVGQAKTAGMVGAETKVELDALFLRAGELQGEIDTERAVEAKMRDLANLDDYLNKPVNQLPHGVGDGDGESDDRKALARAGWQIKSGIVQAPTSLGTMVDMYDESVLFGEVPEHDPSAAEFYKTTRAAFRPEYRVAYTKLIRAAAKFRSESMAYNSLSGSEQKALSEGTDSAGGFLVPPDTQAEMLVRLPQMAVMRRLARIQTTSRDILKWPMAQPATATAGGLASAGGSIFSSGFVGGWAGEAPAFSDTDPAFGEFSIPIKKLRVATKLSNDFVADSAVNILAFLSQNGAENMALVEDQGFIVGLGSALQPRGITLSGASTVDVEGSTTNTISNTTSNTGTAPKLIDLVYGVPSQYVDRAQWLMSRATEGKIRKLVDGSGRFMWPTMLGSGFAGTPRTLMDYPVNNSEFVASDGTDANKVLIFGDFSSYVIAQRAQITSTILRERFADNDQVGIILWERVGGDTWNLDGLRFGIV